MSDYRMLDPVKLDNHITSIPDEPDTPINIISFDVGNTTGVVVAECYGIDDFAIDLVMQFDYNNVHSTLNNLFINNQPDIIIIEDFRLYAHKANAMINNQFIPVRVIGAIESAVYYYDMGNTLPRLQPMQNTSIVYQLAQEIKGKPPVKILSKHEGVLSGLKHAKDAYKHLRLYLTKHFN